MKLFILAAAILIGAAAGMSLRGRAAKRVTSGLSYEVKRLAAYYEMLNQWVWMKNQGVQMEDYLVKKGYRRIAIYGLAELGGRLYEELKGCEGVQVRYIIDKDTQQYCAGLDILAPSKGMPRVDAVIVTPVFAFSSIQKMMEKLTDAPIISLEDVLYEIV